MNEDLSSDNDLERLDLLQAAYRRLREQIGHAIVGQERVIEQLLIAILSGGHALLVGVPGLAKTLMVRTLAESLELSFSRIQFTPDLMPADITGTEVIQQNRSTNERELKFLQGPVFANVVLADEINRTPPKTQAALLEAMQERQVTAGGHRHQLPEPFFVLATQNPIEQEGTYPLPEAQLDRFMFQVLVDYPSEEEEFRIVRQTTAGRAVEIEPVLKGEELLELQEFVRRIPVSDSLIRYAMQFPRLTRGKNPDSPEFIRQFVSWGAGPRASQYLVLGAKAHAALHGKMAVGTDDIQAVAAPVLRHRILTNFNAEAEGISTDDLIERMIALLPLEGLKDEHDGKLPELFRSPNAG
ncbi:MAG TPA: MoxR family ATPase [Planctomycetaceae bacterium]|nr:MoxR family ATPase [Planctomycetaceae bacterium]